MNRSSATSPDGSDRWSEFVGRVSQLVAVPGFDELALIEAAKEALSALVAHDDWLCDAFTVPDPNYYQQYLLHLDPLQRFSVVSFVWGPGQQTPIHDHTTWGLIGMLRGAEVSRSFRIRDGKPLAGREERLEPGEVTVVSPTLGDIHQVRNAFDDRVSISIHVYGGDIGVIERHVYLPGGGIKPFVSGYSTPGQLRST